MRTVGGGTDPADGDIGTDSADGDLGTDPDSDMGLDGGSGTDPDNTIDPDSIADPDSVTDPGANEEILAQMQELIDALPAAEEITEENRAEVQEQLEAIEAALEELTDEDKAMLDLARYDAAAAALSAVHRPRRRQSAARNGSVSYLDASGRTQTCSAYTTISNQTEWNGGWYVLEWNVDISDRIEVKGDVNLILENGCTLTASKGIGVKQNNSLTIYAQSADAGTMGALKAGPSDEDFAGIGGGNVWNYAGDITINGGAVTATGGDSAAGIGGGFYSTNDYAEPGSITINGGVVTATGGDDGAGIGSGYETAAGTITINGGSVTATGHGAAGIGGGDYAAGGTITISGGSVTAKVTSDVDAGIGSAGYAATRSNLVSNITIKGGIVSTDSFIGGDWAKDNSKGCTVTISGGSVTAKKIETTRGTFSTGTGGKAVLHISDSISDESNKSSWSGIIFVKNEGQVYGTPTPDFNFEVKSGETLNVQKGHPLHIAGGVTLTNRGVIRVGSEDDYDGELTSDGSVVNEGTIDVWGPLTYGETRINNQNGGQIIYHLNLDIAAPIFADAPYGSQPSAQPVTMTNNNRNAVTISKVEISGKDKDSFAFETTGSANKSLAVGAVDTSWVIRPKAGLDVGTYQAEVTATYKSAGTDRTSTAELSFTVTKAEPAVTATAARKDGGTLTYGDDITLTATVSASGNIKEGDLVNADSKVTFYVDGTQLGAPVPLTGGGTAGRGTASLEIDGSPLDLRHRLFGESGSPSVTAVYSGNGKFAQKSGTVVMKVAKRELRYTVTAADKTYDGSAAVEVTLQPEGVLQGDAVSLTAAASVTMTAGAAGKKAGDVGTYTTVRLSDIRAGGTDGKYYTAAVSASDVTLTQPVNIGMAKAQAAAAPRENTLTYNGSRQTLVTAGKAEGGVMKYYAGAEAPAAGSADWQEDVSTLTGLDAGDYTVWYYVDGDANHTDTVPVSLTVTIDRAEPVLSVAPAPVPDALTYDGTDQALVTPGTAAGGSLRYYVGQAAPAGGSAAWKTESAEVTGRNAGTYTVWYYIVGSKNYKDSAASYVTVTIGKAEGEGSVSMKGYSCNDDSVEPEADSPTNGTGDVTFFYKEEGQPDTAYSENKPVTAGSYTVRAVFAETGNYKEVTATADFTVTHRFDGGWQKDADGYRHDCSCSTELRLLESGLTEVPEGLKDKDGLDSVAQIAAALRREAGKAGVTAAADNSAIYDVKLQSRESGGADWEEVTEENFPEEGITVRLPYPAGTNARYAFTVIHMISNGSDAGQTERLAVINGAESISFTVKSLSPFCVVWTAPPESSRDEDENTETPIAGVAVSAEPEQESGIAAAVRSASADGSGPEQAGTVPAGAEEISAVKGSKTEKGTGAGESVTVSGNGIEESGRVDAAAETDAAKDGGMMQNGEDDGLTDVSDSAHGGSRLWRFLPLALLPALLILILLILRKRHAGGEDRQEEEE